MLANPAIIYSSVWLFSLFLYTRYWSGIFLELTSLTYEYILSSILAVIISWLLYAFAYRRFNINYFRRLYNFSHLTKHKIKIFLMIWIFGTLIEVLYFRDLPILALFGLSSMTYADFGLPSLHGFLNAIILSLSMYSLYLFILTNDKKYIGYYILTIFVPLVGMNRGMLTSLLIESLFVFIVFKGTTIKTIIKIIFFIIVFALVFGMLGELRYSGNPDNLYAVFNITDNYPVMLPRSFIWIYMYMTSSLNNIENIIYNFNDVNFEPYSAIFGLIPSVIRAHLNVPVQQDLVVSAFNVSSFMPNYLTAYGLYGSIFFYFLASLVSMGVYYRYVSTYSFASGFTLVIFLHSIALSVFSDFFAIQVYMFQVIIQVIIFKGINIKSKRKNYNVQK